MEEEIREQPTEEPANVINITDRDSAVSEVGSHDTFGKFKSAEKLLEAYNNLQSEFTKKCQLLSQLQKDKMEKENQVEAESANNSADTNSSNNDEEISKLNSFLDANADAKSFEEEIKEKLNSSSSDPYQVAWARVVLEHLTSSNQKVSDPIVNKYVLSDSQVRNQVIQDYISDLATHKPPYVISSQGGERVSSISIDTPSSLAEAKEIVNKMFS